MSLFFERPVFFESNGSLHGLKLSGEYRFSAEGGSLTNGTDTYETGLIRNGKRRRNESAKRALERLSRNEIDYRREIPFIRLDGRLYYPEDVPGKRRRRSKKMVPAARVPVRRTYESLEMFAERAYRKCRFAEPDVYTDGRTVTIVCRSGWCDYRLKLTEPKIVSETKSTKDVHERVCLGKTTIASESSPEDFVFRKRETLKRAKKIFPERALAILSGGKKGRAGDVFYHEDCGGFVCIVLRDGSVWKLCDSCKCNND